MAGEMGFTASEVLRLTFFSPARSDCVKALIYSVEYACENVDHRYMGQHVVTEHETFQIKDETLFFEAALSHIAKMLPEIRQVERATERVMGIEKQTRPTVVSSEMYFDYPMYVSSTMIPQASRRR